MQSPGFNGKVSRQRDRDPQYRQNGRWKMNHLQRHLGILRVMLLL
jgi:hypothetical protein